MTQPVSYVEINSPDLPQSAAFLSAVSAGTRSPSPPRATWSPRTETHQVWTPA